MEAIQRDDVESGTNFAALDAIQRQNDGVRDALIAKRLEKEGLQKKSDALDSEACSKSIQLEITEADLLVAKIDLEVLN